MTGFSYTALWRSGVFVFVVLWLAGFALRFIFNPAGMGSIDPVTMPAYRQIIVPGFLRWLFFYKPVKGSVSYPVFMIQLPAFLTLDVTAVLAALFPSLHDAYWLPVIVFSGIGLLSIRFSKWLWTRQQH